MDAASDSSQASRAAVPGGSGWRWVTLAILVLGALLRLEGMPRKSLWIDELITFEVAQRPFWSPPAHEGSVLGFTLHDVGPGPLAYAAEWAVLHAHHTEALLRLPSALFGCAGLLAALLLLRVAVRGPQARLLALLVWALLPSQINLAQEARGYALATLLCLLSIAACAGQWRDGAWRWWWWAVAVQTLAFFASPFTALLFAGLALATLAGSGCEGAPTLQGRLAHVAGGSAAYLAAAGGWAALWIPRAFHGDSVAGGATHLRLVPDAAGWATLGSAWAGLIRGLTGAPGTSLHPSTELVANLLLWALGAGLCLAGACRLARQRPWAILIAATALMPVSLVTLFSTVHFIAPRYLFWVQPILLILLAAGGEAVLSRLPERRRTPALIALGGLIVLSLTPLLLARRVAEKADWRAAADWLIVNASPGDVVLTGPHSEIMCLAHYLEGRPGWAYHDLREHPDVPLDDVLAALDHAEPPRFLLLNGVETGVQIADLAGRGRRLWMLTGFWGSADREPAHWSEVEARFRQAADFPGEMPLRVLLSPPPRR